MPSSSSPLLSASLGFPRIGPKRELKHLVEKFWANSITEQQLLEGCTNIRQAMWAAQTQAGLSAVACNDFSLYDHVLDTTVMVGAIPERYHPLMPAEQGENTNVTLETYFAMARGFQTTSAVTGAQVDVPAMEMKKWFDSNYHYLVPELHPKQEFSLRSTKVVEEFEEALAAGVSAAKPILLGPVSFLMLSKRTRESPSDFDALDLLERILPVYESVLQRLVRAGATWIQMDEPVAVLDPAAGRLSAIVAAFRQAYQRVAAAVPSAKLLLATVYECPNIDLIDTLISLPVAALHVDAVRGDVAPVLSAMPSGGALALSLGVVDARNVWRVDADKALAIIDQAVSLLGRDRVMVAPSSTLLHCPWSTAAETSLDQEVLSWLAFASEKVQEVQHLARLAGMERSSERDHDEWLAQNRASREQRAASPKTSNNAVRERVAGVSDAMLARASPAQIRRIQQDRVLNLPLLPTTTIGSFPQTPEVRRARADHRNGRMDNETYDEFLKDQIKECIYFQETIGLDVLVHGEFERNDMVEFFGERLEGFGFTRFGWVQSYGSRCVKPPIIFGDVSRPAPMTVETTVYAQSLTRRPVKGMLTGPVTCLSWSFVRDDQPRATTCMQLALAIRDEVDDLQKAGLRAIQIDEPAIREGLPLHRDHHQAYLKWAVDAFLLATTVASDDVQIHTHMCYSDFAEIIDAIRRMDADVTSVEAARSDLKLLRAFDAFEYPNQIGPGLYDIHSPRQPSVKELEAKFEALRDYIPENQLWLNPDCGLKTRTWDQVRPALAAITAVAKNHRRQDAPVV